MVRGIEEIGGGPMAWRRVSSFVSCTLGLWLYSAPFVAAITHTTAKLNLRAGHARRRQLNRTFVVPTLRWSLELTPVQFGNRECEGDSK